MKMLPSIGIFAVSFCIACGGGDGDAGAGDGDEGSGGMVGDGDEPASGGGGIVVNPTGPTVSRCSSVIGVDDPALEATYAGIAIGSEVGVGESFSFATEGSVPAGRYELHGARAQCGVALELLGTLELGAEGSLCMTATPANEAYTHLIWVGFVDGAELPSTLTTPDSCP